jgi:hypothetical protein
VKHAFSLVTLKAAALGFAVVLVTFQSGGRQASGWSPSTTASGPDHGDSCRLYGPLLADIQDGIAVLSRFRGV